MRRVARIVLSSFIIGVLSVGVAFAGGGLVSNLVSPDPTLTPTPSADPDEEQAPEAQEAPQSTSSLPLQEGQVLGGAAKVSIEPRPEDFDGTWERDQSQCETLRNPQNTDLGQVTDFRVRWHEDTNCIYMGGFDIGPANAAVEWDDEYGLWVRSVAIGDGEDTVVLTILDGAYYFGEYNNMCNGEQDCGFFDLQGSLGAELDIDPSGFLFASTHSHTSPDFIGAWGGIPTWYMQQVEDSIRASVRGAVGSMRPTWLEAGETLLRGRNSERRNHYRSAEENTFSWLRLIAAADEPTSPACSKVGNGNGQGPPQGAPPHCADPDPGQAVATLAVYAGHPTKGDKRSGVAFGDFPVVFDRNVEERFGGVGLFFQTGLGNMTGSGGSVELGEALAAVVPPIGAGESATGSGGSTPDVRSAQEFFVQPVTNSALGSGGLSGVFDRPFAAEPGAVNVGKSDSPNKKCSSASPAAVRTAVSVAKIGNLVITGGPGELFSNLTNTIREKNGNNITLPLALVNDGLGYLMQSFETDHVGRQAVGFVNGPLSEYEDAYSIDACFGDNVLERTISLMEELN